MGEMTLRDRVWPWIRHPLGTLAAALMYRYAGNHDVEIRYCWCGDAHPHLADIPSTSGARRRSGDRRGASNRANPGVGVRHD